MPTLARDHGSIPWVGTRSDPTMEWKIARGLALKRDHYRCQDCGDQLDGSIPNHLHVHHITPREEFQNEEDAHYLDNLVTLCKYCHPEWEGKEGRPYLLERATMTCRDADIVRRAVRAAYDAGASVELVPGEHPEMDVSWR